MSRSLEEQRTAVDEATFNVVRAKGRATMLERAIAYVLGEPAPEYE